MSPLFFYKVLGSVSIHTFTHRHRCPQAGGDNAVQVNVASPGKKYFYFKCSKERKINSIAGNPRSWQKYHLKGTPLSIMAQRHHVTHVCPENYRSSYDISNTTATHFSARKIYVTIFCLNLLAGNEALPPSYPLMHIVLCDERRLSDVSIDGLFRFHGKHFSSLKSVYFLFKKSVYQISIPRARLKNLALSST